MTNKTAVSTRQVAGLGILLALVAALQVFATFVPIGPYPITLALVPIIIGAAIYGPKAGAVLGATFGAVVFIMTATGADAGGALLFSIRPVITFVLIMLRTAATGLIAGLVYKTLSKKNGFAAVLTAAIAAPVVNTGIFIAGLLIFFMPAVREIAGPGASVFGFILTGILGINFLIELGVNVALASAIKRIIDIRRKNQHS